MFLTIEDFKFIREFYDKTHAEMADVCKVSTSHIWRIENDQRSLTQEIARRIVREFRLSPEKLERLRVVYSQYQEVVKEDES